MKRLLDVNLKKIQYFLCIVEEGNLTRAAARLYVSQPMLSKSMKELERELEIVLFVRENRTLRLTEAGRYLYDQWKGILGQMERQMGEARDIQDSMRRQIHLGCEHIMVLAANAVWMEQLERYRGRQPKVQIDMMALGLQEVKSMFLKGALDMMICSSFDAMGLPPQYNVELLARLPVCIYGRKGHPVLEREGGVGWKDLKDVPFYTISPAVAAWPEELLHTYAMENGYRPRIAGYTETQMSQVMKIKTTDGLMLSLELDALIQDERLCCVKMGDDMTDIILTWKKDSDAAVEELAGILLRRIH